MQTLLQDQPAEFQLCNDLLEPVVLPLERLHFLKLRAANATNYGSIRRDNLGAYRVSPL